jgi:hypothetical protein
MNAPQSKALIAAARKAAWSLHPDSVEARELWSAIHHAETTSKPASREKCVFCEEAGAELDGFSKKLKLRMAHVVCAEAYRARADAFAAWSRQATALRLNADTREQREALKESLTYCACGGKAEDHREDRDGNLLECSHCDGCGQFHYQTDTEQTATEAA